LNDEELAVTHEIVPAPDIHAEETAVAAETAVVAAETAVALANQTAASAELQAAERTAEVEQDIDEWQNTISAEVGRVGTALATMNEQNALMHSRAEDLHAQLTSLANGQQSLTRRLEAMEANLSTQTNLPEAEAQPEAEAGAPILASVGAETAEGSGEISLPATVQPETAKQAESHAPPRRRKRWI
jgi:chaperonin cofactor prefoldin